MSGSSHGSVPSMAKSRSKDSRGLDLAVSGARIRHAFGGRLAAAVRAMILVRMSYSCQ